MQTRKKHMSELIFIVTLFSIFLISGVSLVLFGANVYQTITREADVNETTRTSLSYIQEKLHQCDHKGSIQVETHNGTDTLSLYSAYGDKLYVTYIYYHDGSLKELFIKNDLNFNPAAGNITFEFGLTRGDPGF
ncbi:MAG: DUF4860 domain-containing protein, partial [Eubacteriales bacterium]|nr:DUF4860 domain-containing protein [Eubacteriales bacterium]